MNVVRLGCRAFVLAAVVQVLMLAQAPTPEARKTQDRAASYYHYSMGHLYEQLAREYRSTEHLNKAIEQYKLAIQADPASEFLPSELINLYAQVGRLQDAVREAEAILQRNPSSLQIRRLLGGIYRNYLADPGQGRQLNEDLLRRAVEQYEKIIELDPKDAESHRNLAVLYRVGRDSVKAEKILKKALELEPDSEESLTSLSALYIELGDTAGAIEFLAPAAQRRPTSRILAALGSAYEQAGQNDQAADTLEKAFQLDRSNQDLRRSLAHNLLLADKHDKALTHYQALAQADPQDPQNYLRMAQIHRHKRAFDSARTNLQKAASLAREDSVEISYNEVLLLESEGKTEQAIAQLQKLIDSAVKPNPTARERSNRAFFLEKLGLLERSREGFAAAEKAFRAMVEADEASAPRASVMLVDTLRIARNFRRALEESEAALKKFPKDRPVAFVRAHVLADTGAAAAGADLLRGWLKNTPEDRDTLLTQAQVLEKGKIFDQALAALEKAKSYAQTKEQRRAVYYSSGSLLERQKKYDEAEQQFRLVLELDPDDAAALNYLGYMLADRNVRLEEAYGMIKKAVDLDPDNGAYRDSLGWVFYRQNKLEQAELWLRKSLDKAPRDPTVHDHLADVYFKQGKIRLAMQQWERSLREWEQASQAEINPEEIARIRKKLDSVKVRLAQEQAGSQKRQ